MKNKNIMKRFLGILCVSGLISMSSYAQVSLYSFSQSSVTYTEITGGTVLGNATTDEQRFVDVTVPSGDTATTGVGLPIGFNFTYNGSVFDVFAVNANGWISLGQSSLTPAVNMRSTNYQQPISTASMAPAVLQNRACAFGRNLAGQPVSELSYLTMGTSPNRTLVVQWKKFRRSSTQNGDTINFQIRLNETANSVDFVYGNVVYAGGGGGNTGPQVGLRGQANTDFNNRMSATSWSTTAAGTANNSFVRLSSTIRPPSGLEFTFAPPFQFDAGLTAINSPATPVSIGDNKITVTLKNFGTDTLRDANIEWSVNNVLQTSFPFMNSGIPHAATFGPDSIGTYNFSTTGSYVIKAWTSLPNGHADGNNLNDTITKTVYAQSYATIPFIENFDNVWESKNDTSDVPTAYWSNTPAFGNSSWRRDDDSITAPWTEGTLGAYTPAGANGTIHSAKFHSWYATNNTSGIMDLFVDFSPAGEKILDFWYINTSGGDSLSVYLSTNSGTNFSFIRKFRVVPAWSHYILYIGNSTSANCVVRFKAVSDYGQTDIGIDQVQIYLQPANDMTAVKWISPASGCGLTGTEQVTVRVRNDGTDVQSNIPVKYSIDGGATFTGPENIPGPVNPGDSADFTFTSTTDLSNSGAYNCKFVVNLTGDPVALNDTAYSVIVSSGVISSFPFIENFNTGSSNYFLLSANADANILYDTNGTQSTYGLHFTGKTTNLWAAGTTTAAAAWSHTSHIAAAATCGVDASGISRLNMKFDIRETSSNNANLTYTWYAIVVNDIDTIADFTGTRFFNPASPSDVYSTKYFDLSAYADTSFSLKFISSCRRDLANSTNGLGDNVFFDNLALYEPLIINDLGPDTIICEGNSITYNAGAGTGYTYVWTRLPSPDTISTAPIYTVDMSGTYCIVVTNSLGLTASDTVTVTVNPMPVVSAGNDTIVQYMSIASLFGSVNPPLGDYTYLWAPDSVLADAGVQNPMTDSMRFSTIFTLYVTNNVSGCMGSDQVIVSVIGGPLSVAVYTDPGTICAGSPVSLLALPSGGSGTYTYNWTSSPAGFASTVADTMDYPLVTTTYRVGISDGTDAATDSVTVTVHDLPVVSLGNDAGLCMYETITLDAGTAISYIWSTGETTQTITVDSTNAIGGVATIWVNVTNEFGCMNTDTIVITFQYCTGINENAGKTSVSVYPNPTNGYTNIRVNGLTGNAELSIFTMEGQSVYNEHISGNNVTGHDLSYLPKGVYIVRINNEKTNLITKLIIR